MHQLISQKAELYEVDSCLQSPEVHMCFLGILNYSLNYQIKQMEVDWSLGRVACTVRLNVSRVVKRAVTELDML